MRILKIEFALLLNKYASCINDVRNFSKGFFPSGNFPTVSFPKSVLAAALCPHCSLQRLRGPNLTFLKLLHGKLHIWEVATWDFVTWEVALGKMPSGKYLTPTS